MVRPTVLFLKLLKSVVLLVFGAVLVLLVLRSWNAFRGDPLQVWHTYVPDELNTQELALSDWADYIDREDQIFEDLQKEVVEKIPEDQKVAANRYYQGSLIHPENFHTNWNRSYIMQPEGTPLGSVILLHGLTDSPYSLRHLGRFYRERGFVVVGIRLPGHGTVPGGLTKIYWQNWLEATRLAVREGVRLSGPTTALHLVGFSNGGALALQYAMDAMEDSSLKRPDQIVLISPMIGVTALARFAGVAGWPSIFPAFAKTAWLDIMPEFNPFKYNSFPINGARQSSLLTRRLQPRLTQYEKEGRLNEFPPVLTFQSAMDSTTSTRAVIDALHARLPGPGHELVLFDLNRNAALGPLLRPSAGNILTRILPPPPRRYSLALVTNAAPDTQRMVEVYTPSGSSENQRRDLGLEYPPGVYSLSHVALPFPLDDSLYGLSPTLNDEYGISLGSVSPRGERSTLIVSLDALIRMSSNPFFPYMLDKIGATLPSESVAKRLESESNWN